MSNASEPETLGSTDYKIKGVEEESTKITQQKKQAISYKQADHFKEASDALKYSDKKRRPGKSSILCN